MHFKKKKAFYAVTLVAYASIMIWLMLLKRIGTEHHNALCLVPFTSTMEFLQGIRIGFMTCTWSLVISGIANLAGNIVMFIPLGLLIPPLWRRQRCYPVFLITMALVICCMEAIQFFTGLGTADIDDLILNLIGVTIGFIIFRRQRT